jgi:hypothetical protein
MNISQPSKEQPPRKNSIWPYTTYLFTAPLAYFDRGRNPVDVRARYSVETKPYSRHERDTEIVQLQHRSGIQTYYHIQPYVLTPRITFTDGLYDKPIEYADQEPSIGHLIGSQQEGYDETVIGTSQAYYYHQDRLLVLWEAYLHNHFTVTEHEKKTEDPNLRLLWTNIEHFLTGRHSEAERIVTLWDDGEFETEAYRVFLRSLGYQEAVSGTYGKQL